MAGRCFFRLFFFVKFFPDDLVIAGIAKFFIPVTDNREWYAQ